MFFELGRYSRRRQGNWGEVVSADREPVFAFCFKLTADRFDLYVS